MEIEARPEITRAPLTAVVIGLAAGMFSALLGVGGGLLMVPGMVYLLRIRLHRAHGTSLAVVLPAAVAAVSQYAGRGEVIWSIALLLALGSVFGAVIGALMASALHAPRLKQWFGLFVVIFGVFMVAAPNGYGGTPGARIALDAHGWPVIALVGLGAGLLSGLLGVGGGVVMVPAVVFLLGAGQRVAQGISLAIIIPVAASGVFIHYRKGNVIPYLAFWLACGAVVGAYVVGHWVGKMPEATLKLLFGLFLIAFGITLVTHRRRGVTTDGK